MTLSSKSYAKSHVDHDKNRNIYFRGAKMIITFTYNKTDIRNDTKLISRVYPTIVAKLVYFYVNYVLLYEISALVGLTEDDALNRKKLRSLLDLSTRYLFIDLGTNFVIQDIIYSLVKTLSAECLGKQSGVRDWRQIMVQFTKKNISSTTKLSSNLIYRFLESQVGHSSTVAMSNYEKTSTREFENSIVEPQQQMSERWIEIINLPTDLTCIADFVPDVWLQESVLY